MRIISMSQKRFKSLKPLDLPDNIMHTESELFEFREKGKDKVFKKLVYKSGQRFGNKLYTLEMLDSNKEYMPNNFWIPDSILSVGGSIEGFIIPKVNGINLYSFLENKDIKPKDKLFYLKKIGEMLNQLSYIRKTTPLKDFYINDLNVTNFIVNPSNCELSIINLDSAKIGTNAACPARLLTPKALLNNVKGKYNINEDRDVLGHVIADENSDLYCYIMVILNYLYGSNLNTVAIEEFYEYMNYLEYIGINQNLVSLFERIVTNKNNKNPEYLLSSITDEQVYRASEKVYKRVKK